MNDDGGLSAVLTLARGDADEVLALVDGDDCAFALVLHTLLRLYHQASLATRTTLGLVGIGALLLDIAANDSDADVQRAGLLVLHYGTAVAGCVPDCADDSFPAPVVEFAVAAFNTVLDEAHEQRRINELLPAIVSVWRRLLPELHDTPDGLVALQVIGGGR